MHELLAVINTNFKDDYEEHATFRDLKLKGHISFEILEQITRFFDQLLIHARTIDCD